MPLHHGQVICPQCKRPNPQSGVECVHCGYFLLRDEVRPPIDVPHVRLSFSEWYAGWLKKRWYLSLLFWVLTHMVIQGVSDLFGYYDCSWPKVLVSVGAYFVIVYLTYQHS